MATTLTPTETVLVLSARDCSEVRFALDSGFHVSTVQIGTWNAATAGVTLDRKQAVWLRDWLTEELERTT